MILKDLIDQLANGELANSSIGTNSDLTLERDNYSNILPHLNTSLTKIFTKLNLKESSVTIVMDTTIDTYKLNYKYAQSNAGSLELVKYIDDTAITFLDDCLKITSIFDELGNEYEVNDISADFPIWLLTPSSFKVKYPSTNTKLIVNYKANHPRLNINNIDPLTTEIEIPDYAEEALKYLIASKVYAVTPSITEGVNSSIFYDQKYKEAISELHMDNLGTQEKYVDNNNFRREGWL